MGSESQRVLLTFHLAGLVAALPLEKVKTIAPMARLVRPPGLPSPLEGILNLAGKAVPVLRLGRLLELPVGSPGLHSMLIVLKSTADGRIALLVDRISEILSVAESELLPLKEEHSFNACAESTVPSQNPVIYVLSPARILLEKERESISEFQAMAQRRLNEGECGKSVRTMSSSLDAVIGDPQYPQLKELVVESTGLSYYSDKDAELARRVEHRMAVTGIHNCGSYLDILRDPARGASERDALIAEVTIGETYFFRHREHFDALRDLVLPDLVARNRANRRLRIWCAGCSDGPEPYSVAILLKREMAQQLLGWEVTILGTDINRHGLARAREGKFEEWALRGDLREPEAPLFFEGRKSFGASLRSTRNGFPFDTSTWSRIPFHPC